MNNPGQFGGPFKGFLKRLSPKQRQYAAALAILTAGVGTLWGIFSFSDNQRVNTAAQRVASDAAAAVINNLGVMPAGQQVSPVDQWVGTAGHKLAQYESERGEQARINRDREAFETRTMQHFTDLEQKLTSANQARLMTSAPHTPLNPAPSPIPSPITLPPALKLPPAPPNPRAISYSDMPSIASGTAMEAPPPIVQSQVSEPSVSTTENLATTAISPPTSDQRAFLPIGVTRAILLGGIDAPTGGQAQSNPQPVLIQLTDTSILPNRFRGEYKDCFIIAAGYGDISSERAYLRTEILSCVRADGSALETKIQGSIFGEDGKLGLRGRVVTKQGQMLANALLAGVTGGIGQGISTSANTVSSSAFGAVSTSTGSEAFRTGIGSGVGRALDRLAQYYIKLAEQTFPVIEIDAGRQIDVVLTQGVRIDLPEKSNQVTAFTDPEDRYLKESHDDED